MPTGTGSITVKKPRATGIQRDWVHSEVSGSDGPHADTSGNTTAMSSLGTPRTMNGDGWHFLHV